MPQALKDMLNPGLPKNLFAKAQRALNFQRSQNLFIIKAMQETEEKFSKGCKFAKDLAETIAQKTIEKEGLRTKRRALQQRLTATLSFNSSLNRSYASTEPMDCDDSGIGNNTRPKTPVPDPRAFKTPAYAAPPPRQAPTFSFSRKEPTMSRMKPAGLMPFAHKKTSTPTIASQHKVLQGNFSFRSNASSRR